MQNHSSFGHELRNGCEASGAECVGLFFNGHVEVRIGHGAVRSRVMIADQIHPTGTENAADLGVELGRMTLVPQFMNGLIRDNAWKCPESVGPVGFLEAAFDKGGVLCERTKPGPGQSVHGCRKIQEYIINLSE